MITVVVPAHNEEPVIDRCLRSLTEGVVMEVEVLVVCNGCTDGTAERARAFGGPVRVVEIPEASKVAALNVADDMLTTFPRVYLDADVELSPAALLALVEPLETGGCDLTVSRSTYLLEDASRIVRSYLRFWARLPQVSSISAGCGVYALSAQGRARFERWPETTNDDAFVRTTLGRSSKVVEGATSVVRPPRTVRALVNRKRRVATGNRQLRRQGHRDGYHPWLGWLSVIRDHPGTLADLPAYLGVTLVSRLGSVSGGRASWAQDRTSRLASFE